MLCGISPAFAGLFPIRGQIAHVLRTRAPCAHPYCYRLRTRLACVKHAASVRSEPGSNSRLKPVAWGSPLKSGQQKSPGKFPEPADPSKIVSRSNYSKSLSALEAQIESNRFWHIDSVVKERLFASLSSRVASNELTKISKAGQNVNTPLQAFLVFHTLPQRELHVVDSVCGCGSANDDQHTGVVPCDLCP